jgi:hypothetical protein
MAAAAVVVWPMAAVAVVPAAGVSVLVVSTARPALRFFRLAVVEEHRALGRFIAATPIPASPSTAQPQQQRHAALAQMARHLARCVLDPSLESACSANMRCWAHRGTCHPRDGTVCRSAPRLDAHQ